MKTTPCLQSLGGPPTDWPTLVTVAFGPHHLEAIPAMVACMRTHDTILLEEPPTPGFNAMLARRLPVGEYLMQTDPGFPRFARAACQALQDLHADGHRILQVEPFLDGLAHIHERFADGALPADILANEELHDIYLAEKEATGALIAFYAASRKADFPALIEAVLTFARQDAARIRLRDQLRAQAIVDLAGAGRSLYVEAGFIHFDLFRRLRVAALPKVSVEPVFLLKPEVDRLGVPRRNIGPGDALTLHCVFHDRVPAGRAALLAARSLIAVQLVSQEELAPDPIEPFPHCADDGLVNQLVDRLDLDQCRRLHIRIQGEDRPTALQLAGHLPAERG
ncbi:MAG: hypothetical protein RBT36_04220 [Desulfobulbus sp.]|nr:hypothetical protein [Desulfobulbus sp.]